MISPSSLEIQNLAKEYDVIPISTEIYADIITPISLLRKLADRFDKFYLLESIVGGEKWGRYSFLGFEPSAILKCKNGVIEFISNDTKTVIEKTPYDAIRDILSKYKAPKIKGLPPFAGGLVGYFSYSMIEIAEPVLNLEKSDFNDYELMLFDKVIAYDHLKQKIVIIANMKTDNVLQNYGKAVGDIEKLKLLVTENMHLKETKTVSKPKFTCNVTKDEFCNMVEKTKEYIVGGDIFQAVISRKFTTEYSDSLINAYRVLRTTNPSPYMVYMKCDDAEIISTSPETLVKLKDGKLSTFPIAGSRPRGETEDEDMAFEKELLLDEKELAEHNMLVDLARNDIGRISKLSSVYVSEYMKIHKYAKIMHICSEVNGEISEKYDSCKAIESILPAGTLSGAPKIRACEIIEEIEKSPRGIYGGAIGYIDFTGNTDTCIAIRMAVKKGNTVTVQAGGGIVADSVPESEYIESENKAKAIINAIMNASEVDGL